MSESFSRNRYNPELVCNNCKSKYHPYPDSVAPIIDEVACPHCGQKRILYYGDDSSVVKMILTSYGVNKEVTERLGKIESQVVSLKDMMKTSLDDARTVMTTAIIGALNEQLAQHEKEWHNFGDQHGKPQN